MAGEISPSFWPNKSMSGKSLSEYIIWWTEVCWIKFSEKIAVQKINTRPNTALYPGGNDKIFIASLNFLASFSRRSSHHNLRTGRRGSHPAITLSMALVACKQYKIAGGGARISPLWCVTTIGMALNKHRVLRP
jgi:hypothetical protein